MVIIYVNLVYSTLCWTTSTNSPTLWLKHWQLQLSTDCNNSDYNSWKVLLLYWQSRVRGYRETAGTRWFRTDEPKQVEPTHSQYPLYTTVVPLSIGTMLKTNERTMETVLVLGPIIVHFSLHEFLTRRFFELSMFWGLNYVVYYLLYTS